MITQDGTNWIGLVTCSTGQNLIRLNFGNTLANNSPVVTDFGSLGGVLTSPEAICLDQENSLWYAMIMAGGNTLARITFGNSLLNAPAGVNLGNPGGFNSASGLTLLRDCGSTTGYWTNYLVNGELGKLTFPDRHFRNRYPEPYLEISEDLINRKVFRRYSGRMIRSMPILPIGATEH